MKLQGLAAVKVDRILSQPPEQFDDHPDQLASWKAQLEGGAADVFGLARRKFVEVYKTTQSPFAREVIERLQAVYVIEAEIRGSSAEQRLAARTRTAPLMETLRARLTAMVGQLFSQSKLAVELW